MSQSAEPQTTVVPGRYSKRKRTQVNYRMEELDVDETDAEWENEAVEKKKPRKTAASKPLFKRRIFPFLQLPAEIRNLIYHYALVDPSGINFVAVQRNKRRCVERVSNETFDQVTGCRTYYHPKSINKDAEDQATELVPSLLAVNKQIHREGRDMLYSNELNFADPVALYAFMINLGPGGSALYLKTMRLKGWGYGRTTKTYNNACFAVLIWAENLEKLYIDSDIGWYRQPKNVAQQIYRDAFPWLEAVGRTTGKFDAALDVLNVATKSFGGNSYHASQGHSDAQRREAFNDELRRNLELQHNRVMSNKSVKKRKILKANGRS